MAKVLVVEDDAAMRHLMRMALEGAGHSVSEAAHGAEALRHLDKNPCDVMILDIFLDVMDSFELIYRLHKTSMPLPKTIAITAGGPFGPGVSLRTAEAMGALRTFAKPFDLKKLLAAVQEVLSEPDP